MLERRFEDPGRPLSLTLKRPLQPSDEIGHGFFS